MERAWTLLRICQSSK